MSDKAIMGVDVLLFAVGSSIDGKTCTIGQEPIESGIMKWVMKDKRPQDCEKIIPGGMNTRVPPNKTGNLYFDEPYFNMDNASVRAALKEAVNFRRIQYTNEIKEITYHLDKEFRLYAMVRCMNKSLLELKYNSTWSQEHPCQAPMQIMTTTESQEREKTTAVLTTTEPPKTTDAPPETPTEPIRVTNTLSKTTFILTTETPKGCPQPYKEYNGKCFKFVDSQISYDGAEDNCNFDNAHVASIPDAGTNAFLSGLRSQQQETWIGLKDNDQTRNFLWENGDESTYINWKAGMPDNGNWNEYCVRMTDEGTWNDMSCDRLYSYFCAKYK